MTHEPPIKIFNANGAVGLFSIVDAVTKIDSFSRPGESWSLYAGRVSGLNLHDEKKSDHSLRVWKGQRNFSEHDGRGNIEFYEFLDHLRALRLGDNKEDKYELHLYPIQLSKVQECSEAQLGIMKRAWKEAYQYRSCVNSFNKRENYSILPLLDDLNSKNIFRSGYAHYWHHPNGERKKKNKLDFTNFAKEGGGAPLSTILIETVLDVLNRPLRLVPCFEYTGLTTSDRAEATMDFGKPFFYPIDYHNLDFFDRTKGAVFTSPIGWKTFGVTEKQLLKHGDHLTDFISEIIREFCSSHSKSNKGRYPWNVKPLVLRAEGQPMHVLLFNPKAEESS